MSHLDYDVVFFRVFCVTLLAVAFTFTVILTNVFVDIDGLLSNKKTSKNALPHLPESSPTPESYMYDEEVLFDAPKDAISDEDKNYDNEINPLYRTKRSIETVYHAKSPAIKKMLTRQLASLLEELDEEEAKKEVKFETTTTKKIVKVENSQDGQTLGVKNDDMLHLAMHNILLQGLIEHTAINDVYKKVHELLETFEKRISNRSTQDGKLKTLNAIINSKEILQEVNKPNKDKNSDYIEEHIFFEELMKCKRLEEQIAKITFPRELNITKENQIRKDDKVYIKTVIEINENDNKNKGPNNTHAKENVEGLIKLIYNGKSIKINQVHDEIQTEKPGKSEANNNIEIRDQVKNPVVNKFNKGNVETENKALNQDIHNQQPSLLLNKVLEEYLKKHSFPSYKYLQNSAEIENNKTQRLKRQVKQRYSNNDTTSSKTKPVNEGKKKDDDDLYIEIETHFDGKGIKGEKKKKLVRSLIDKIQKALHSDIEQKHESVEHFKFVKRTQDPIYSQNKVLLPHKLPLEQPLEPIEHRQLDPIGKTSEALENISDRHGNTWKKHYIGPNFLSLSKSVNSAEMNELNIDYETVLKNGISKRLQKPLNTETEDGDDRSGLFNPSSDNVTLLLKDIDGSGFSIGFNQYEGEPPDKDSMRMFNGIENLIREYHKTYDQANTINNESAINNEHGFVKRSHEIMKRNVEHLHNVFRRSITKVGTSDYNNNKSRPVFKEDPSFDKYLNIFKRRDHKLKFDSLLLNDKNVLYNVIGNDITQYKNSLLKEVPIIVDERILNIKLKPFELFSIANLINRKKRSLSVKRISNLKSKIKLSRFLNTKSMAKKNVFLMNKRNKRAVNSIRIIARDKTMIPQKNSDENIFFISRENSYTNKEIIRAVKTTDRNLNNRNTEYSDEELPFNNIYKIQNPNMQTSPTDNVYNTALRSNKLMSQYPHIFVGKDLNTKEDTDFDEKLYKADGIPYRIEASPETVTVRNNFISEQETTTEPNLTTDLQNLSVPNVEEMVGAIMPHISPNNYKITVKVTPKNITNTNARFKEIHTTVNKSFDENGLRYYTVLNISQISKIETINKTGSTRVVAPISQHLIDQQEQIKTLLELHKQSVDLQLNTLRRESINLEKMIELNKNDNINKTINLLTGFENGLELANEKKIMSSMRKKQDNNNNASTITLPLTTSTPLTALTTETSNSNKSLIIDTIKQNEKVTFEILNKIDTNTHMLQKFLQMYSKKLDSDKNKYYTIETTTKSALEMKLDLSKDWKTYGVNKDDFFAPNEPKNNTIPFIYAYQQSIPMKNRSPPQLLASLVYHGHIHSNAVQISKKNHTEKFSPKIEHNKTGSTISKKEITDTKLLLKKLNNFKVMPNRMITANIKINNTHV